MYRYDLLEFMRCLGIEIQVRWRTTCTQGPSVAQRIQMQSTENMYLFLAVRLQEKALFQCPSSKAQNKPQICSRFESFLALPKGGLPLFCFDFRRVHVKRRVDRISLRIE